MTNTPRCGMGGQTTALEHMWLFGFLNAALLTDVVFVCSDWVLG